MVAMLLGASNSWFGISLSALSLPESTNKLEQLVSDNWAALKSATSSEVLTGILAALQAMGQLREFAQYSTSEIWVIGTKG